MYFSVLLHSGFWDRLHRTFNTDINTLQVADPVGQNPDRLAYGMLISCT